ncbi:MAG: hypothetical protein H0W81_07875 [Chloroflexi bacterium]|nr:hypothetical protein [Chloroflexota bacterium]
MVDEELVLRFLALHDDYARYKPPLKRFLNEFMAAHQNPTKQWLQSKTEVFEQTIRKVVAGLGPSAFRISDGQGGHLKDSWSARYSMLRCSPLRTCGRRVRNPSGAPFSPTWPRCIAMTISSMLLGVRPGTDPEFDSESHVSPTQRRWLA